MGAADALGMLAVFGDPAPPELARTLDLAGYRWKSVGSVDEAAEHEPATGWVAAIVDCSGHPDAAWAFARTLRRRDPAALPLLVLVTGGQLADLELRDELFDDFCLTPLHPTEFEARVRHLLG